MNILVLHTQVPFVSGGAELHVTGLETALREHGHTVDVVALPLQWNPPDRLLTTALAWRLLDLSKFNEKVVDRVICTKFPTWAVEHDHKLLWLTHQHRQAYDLYGTSMSEFTPDPASVTIRERVIEIDQIGISECRRRFTISQNTANRLKRYNGIDAKPLYPPVPRLGLEPESYDPFILSVSRLDRLKRIDCAIEAFRYVTPDLTLEIVGDGPDRARLEQLAKRTGVSSRVRFRGRVSDECLRNLYNTCRAVYYAPIDEDYGYTTVETLTAGKPVITASDSGGPLEFVTNEQTGVITSLDPATLAQAFDRFADEPFAQRLGSAGPDLTRGITWDNVVRSLIGD